MALLGDAPLNKLPQGLLDFFGIKSFGRYPQFLTDRVQPIIELWEMYSQTNSTVITASGEFTADDGAKAVEITSTSPVQLSNGLEVRVPNDEVWYISRASVVWTFDALAGQYAAFGLRFTNEDIVLLPPLLNGVGFNTSDAGIGRGNSASMESPIFLRPGTRISGTHYGVFGATPANPVLWTISWWMNRMKV